jgi:hypothetical protein
MTGDAAGTGAVIGFAATTGLAWLIVVTLKPGVVAGAATGPYPPVGAGVATVTACEGLGASSTIEIDEVSETIGETYSSAKALVPTNIMILDASMVNFVFIRILRL